MAFDFEWKYLATSEGSYIEQEIHRASPGFTVTARKNGKVKQRTFSVAPRSAGYEVILDAKMLENVERICAEAAEHCTAPPVTVGLKDLVITPAHAMLTIHEIVAHPTELDRVVGYEANYAGTSFISLRRRRQDDGRARSSSTSPPTARCPAACARWATTTTA